MASLALPWAVPPAFYLLGGALLLAVLRGLPRKIIQVAGPVLAIWQVLSFTASASYSMPVAWMGYSTQLLHVDELRIVFGLIFGIMALTGSIYALHLEDRGQNATSFLYAAGALGVSFAGDMLSFLVFWELMSVASVVLVLAHERLSAKGAGLRYIAMHALGGAMLFAGFVAWYAQTHSIAIVAIPPHNSFAAWMMLLGVAINAAIWPLGAWLPDAYGDGTPTGSVFLSAFTTKSAVLALLLLFPGWHILIWAGVIMAMYGTVYAIIENNIRRILSYSTISQVGYMVAAAGMGTALALDGATAHAFCHILYKSLLFMGAGAVLFSTGTEKLTELGGLYKVMPWTMGFYAVGAASIAGVPLFNGFVSKSMIIAAGANGGWWWVAIALTLASLGTYLHTGLRLIFFTFFSPKERTYEHIKPLPKNMSVAMALGSGLCILFGVWPDLLYRMLPFGSTYHPFTVHHVVDELQLLVMGAFAFWLLIGKLQPRATLTLDTDWLYRKPLPFIVLGLSRRVMAGQHAVGVALGRLAGHVTTALHDPMVAGERLLGRGILEEEEIDMSAARYRLPVGLTVIAMLAVLAIVVLMHIVG